MISRLFNASFKESKQLIYEPNILKSSKRNKNEPTVIINSFRDTWFFPVMMFLVLVATYFVYSPSNRILMVGINSVLVAYILFMFYWYPRLHHKNWANMEKKRLPVILAYVLAFFLCTYPLLKNCSFEYSGSVSMAFQAALWVSVIITCYYWYIKIPLEDLKPTSISKMAGRIWGFFLIVDFILATLSFITGSYHFSKYIEPQLRSQTTDTRDIYKLMDGCFILSMAVVLIILLLFVYFKLFLTYYYLEKYDKEYRKFYKIPDNLWYLSSEEARKRNDPVYPSHKSFPSQRNNKK